MKKIYNSLFVVMGAFLISDVAGAAGTYYNNNNLYQRYGANSGMGYASKYGQKNTTTTMSRTRTTRTMARNTTNKKKIEKNKPIFNLGLSHENALWNFEMASAKSKLRYDAVAWNVLDGGVSYYFGDTTPMQVKVGARYGMQFGDASMIDDDITGGGYYVYDEPYVNEAQNVLGYQTGHAVSVGTSNGGNQYGFNAEFGLTDYFKYGNVKFTPSIGYRYLKHKLTTKNNYGVSIDVFEATDLHEAGGYVTWEYGYMDEIQYDPFVLFYTQNYEYYTITGHLIQSNGLSDYIVVPTSINGLPVAWLDVGGTYYYEQPGTSHEYNTTWAGPYLGLDMEYTINNNNSITGRVELGLPVYTSEGNQPYRIDWVHPKSVEDSGSLGDAVHFGMNAMWKTAVTDATTLTLGFSYDYYTVSNATAKTFLSSSYYTDMYTTYQNYYNAAQTDAEREFYQGYLDMIDGYRNAGWVLTSDNEISSIYKSMGFRVGLEMKF